MVLIALKNAVTDLTRCEVELTAPRIVNNGIDGMTHVSPLLWKSSGTSFAPGPLVTVLGSQDHRVAEV